LKSSRLSNSILYFIKTILLVSQTKSTIIAETSAIIAKVANREVYMDIYEKLYRHLSTPKIIQLFEDNCDNERLKLIEKGLEIISDLPEG